jgi:kynurenine formamidase
MTPKEVLKMCSPRIMETVRQGLTRRGVLGALGAAATVQIAARLPVAAQEATPVASRPGALNLQLGSYTMVQDLTHTITPETPLYPAGYPQPEMQPFKTYEEHGFYANLWTFVEHTGTHMDAPAHFVEGAAYSNTMSLPQFFAPLAVIDISERAASDPDAQLMPDDVLAWEDANGPLPAGAFVAMNSGWASRIDDPAAFINQDADGALHFPGIHPDTAALLIEERDVVGVGVDTLSLDFGGSTDFGTHFTVLGAGKYGLENLAELASVPAAGALLIVGGPKFTLGSGGPSRVMALY